MDRCCTSCSCTPVSLHFHGLRAGRGCGALLKHQGMHIAKVPHLACPAAAMGEGWGEEVTGDLNQYRQRLEQAFRQSKSLQRPMLGPP